MYKKDRVEIMAVFEACDQVTVSIIWLISPLNTNNYYGHIELSGIFALNFLVSEFVHILKWSANAWIVVICTSF